MSFGRVNSVAVTFDDGTAVTVARDDVIMADVQDWTSPAGQDFKSLLTLRLQHPETAEGGAKMSEREELILAEALAVAILALERLPDDRRPSNNIQDMKKIFDGMERWRDIALTQAHAWSA